MNLKSGDRANDSDADGVTSPRAARSVERDSCSKPRQVRQQSLEAQDNRRNGDDEEQALFRAFCHGNEAAFIQIAEIYEPRLRNYFWRMLKNHQQAADCTQDIFVKLIQGSQKGLEAKSLRAWIYTVARRHWMDVSRKRRAEPMLALNDPDEANGSMSIEQVPDQQSVGAERMVATTQLSDKLRSAIENLPEEQREVLLMKEGGHLSFSEIGEVIGISTATAKSRMRYALEGLRRRLSKIGVTAEDARVTEDV